jgi:hypothetical protein
MEALTVHTPATPSELLSQAIDKGLDVPALEKLMALQERWEANQARKAFFSAITEFQNECPDLRKTKKVSMKLRDNNVAEYHYAPLSDIARQIKKLLKDNGLSYRWEIQDSKDEIKVTCLVTHVDGHTEQTTMQSNPDTSGAKNAIQARGSAIEYMKRYTLIGALGITTADSDIDGRLPELDVDKLHKQYMEIYGQIIQKDPAKSTTMDPDNWAIERTPQVYVQAIGKARQVLASLVKP